MAITKVSQYNSTPTAVSDYQAQNAHLQAFINQLNGSVSVLNQSATTIVPKIKQGSYISMGGTAYIVDTEDYTILGSLVAGLNYIALAVSGDNLTATWTNSLSGYSWNPIYNYYSDGTSALLPYAINYSSSNYYISQFDRTFNQGLKTTNSPTFVAINTGHGTNKLYAMDQHVRTTDDVEFSSVKSSNGYLLQNSYEVSSATESTIFSLFDSLIPNIGDTLPVFGRIELTIVNCVRRTSATKMLIYAATGNGIIIYNIDEDETETFSNIYIFW